MCRLQAADKLCEHTPECAEETTLQSEKLNAAKRKQKQRFLVKKKESIRLASDAHISALNRAAGHVEHLRADLNTLEEHLERQSDAVPVIPVKKDGKTYSNDIRETSYCLQGLGMFKVLESCLSTSNHNGT